MQEPTAEEKKPEEYMEWLGSVTECTKGTGK